MASRGTIISWKDTAPFTFVGSVEEGVERAKEYAEDHLPGAVNYPLRRLEKDADQIDRNRPVIVYCWDAA